LKTRSESGIFRKEGSIFIFERSNRTCGKTGTLGYIRGKDGLLTKVYRLQGKNSWGSQQDFPLPSPLPDPLIVQAYVKPIGNQLPGSIGLRNPDVGTWGTGIGGVGFSGNGKLNAMGGASTSYWFFR